MSRPAVGALRHRLTLEGPMETADDMGGRSLTFESIAAVWSDLRALSAKHDFQAGRSEQRTTHRVTLRWRNDVKPGMRLRDGDRVFNIRAVSDLDEGGAHLECLCEEIV